jgi:hypothetical protein
MSEFINTIDLLGDEVVLDSLIDGSITEYKDDVITTMGRSALGKLSNLVNLVVPNVTTIETEAITNCPSLTTLDLPSVTSIGDRFCNFCSNLEVLIFRSHFSLDDVGSALASTKIANKQGYMYVLREDVDALKTINPFKDFSSQIRALEDYTVDGTTTGALDENKI